MAFPVAPLRALAAQWLLCIASVKAASWTVTSYYALSTTVSTNTDFSYEYTWTDTVTIKPSATITATPTSTDYTTNTYDHVKIVEVWYDAADIRNRDIVSKSTYDPDNVSYEYTTWIQDIVYTAPSSCPTAFTVKTYTTMDIPTEVEDQITPTSKSTSIYSYSSGGYTYTRVKAYLSENQVPLPVETTSNYIESYYVKSCRNPTATDESYWGPSGSPSYDDDDDDSSSGRSSWSYCSYIYGCAAVKTWVIVVATIIPSLFLLGFIESFFWFRRLMLGKNALRFGTTCWCLLCLWIICFTRNTPARNPADQPGLREQWNALPMGTRFKLWFKWGFRHAYPVDLLGPDPRGGVTVASTAPPKLDANGQPIMAQQPVVDANGQPIMMAYPGQPIFNGQQPQPVYFGQPPFDGQQPPFNGQPPYMQPQYNMAPPGTTPSPIQTDMSTPPPGTTQPLTPLDRAVSPPSTDVQSTPPPDNQQQPPQQPPQQPSQQTPQQPPKQ